MQATVLQSFIIHALSLFKNIYLFLAMLGLRCFLLAFSSCGVQRCSRVTGHFSLQGLRLLRSTGPRVTGSSSRGARALLPHSMWDLPGPRAKLVSPALQAGFLTTGPQGKPLSLA